MNAEIINFLKSIELPNPIIGSEGVISRAFLENGVVSFWDAIVFVKSLKYDRISDIKNCSLVLEEKRGTCSAKSALIAALAEELNIPLHLYFGFYELTSEEFPIFEPNFTPSWSYFISRGALLFEAQWNSL